MALNQIYTSNELPNPDLLVEHDLSKLDVPRITLEDLYLHPSKLLSAFQKHSYAILTNNSTGKELLSRTIALCVDFFTKSPKLRNNFSGQTCPLSCWGLGFTDQYPVREMYHACSGALHIHPNWPMAEFKTSYVSTMDWMQSICERCLVIIMGEQSLMRWKNSNQKEGDPSILDCFYYFNQYESQLPVQGENLKSHLDPGLLTLKCVSEEPGLQLFDFDCGKWIDAEQLCNYDNLDLLIFPGEAIENSRLGHNLRIRGSPHRVRTSVKSRLSLVYEMRTHLPDYK